MWRDALARGISQGHYHENAGKALFEDHLFARVGRNRNPTSDAMSETSCGVGSLFPFVTFGARHPFGLSIRWLCALAGARVA